MAAGGLERTRSLEPTVLAIAAGAVVLRGAAFLAWEQLDFDSDQAVIGLMAKHIAEGRARPLFQYAHDYVLAVEPWLAAPGIGTLGATVGALKLPLVGLNVVAALLLLRILMREAGLAPWQALAASAFFIFPPPITSAHLVRAMGMNIEPFVFVLLLWILRRRALLFGVVFAVGFLTREFVAYGLSAILLLEAVQGSLFRRQTAGRALRAGAAAAAVFAIVALLEPHADRLGPGTPPAAAPVETSNMDVLGQRFCFAPAELPGHLREVFVDQLGVLFGGARTPLLAGQVNSTVVEGAPGFWLLTAAVLLAAAWTAGRAIGRAGLSGADAPGLYLILVGLQAAAVYTIARCGPLSLATLRYMLLSLFVPIGVLALFLRHHPSNRWQLPVLAFVAVWTALSVGAHARLVREYAVDPPAADHRALADYLEATGVRYGTADYWTAYTVDYLSGERVALTSPFVRVAEYEQLFGRHADEAVFVLRRPCTDEGPEPRWWTRVRHWYVCAY